MSHFPARLFISTIAVMICNVIFAQKEYTVDSLLFSDGFDQLESHWIIETGQESPANVQAINHHLVIDAPKEVTVWFNQKLTGNILIECKRKVLMLGERNDRLSDFNFFWMATDPKQENLFTRNGNFQSYDSLRLYYAGMGGNSNTTTRFRKYEGNGDKNVLAEYTDSLHLLQPNHEYEIKILVKDGHTCFWVDDELYFFFDDRQPLVSGYFGFRTTKSRQEIGDYKVYRVK